MPLDGKEITIPSTVTEIAPDSIWRAKAIHCERYSTAAQYADVEGIPVVYTDDATSGQEIKADGFTFWVKNGEATLVRAVSEERCTLYIPDHIYEYPVTQIASYTTRNNVKDTYHQDIYTSIVIPATVRRIDSYAFSTEIITVVFAVYTYVKAFSLSETMHFIKVTFRQILFT